MFSLLLAIIYIAFISLGLPDSLLGSGWPVMRADLNVPVAYAGIITMIIAGGTIVSSLLSDKLTKKLGAGLITAISVFMTAAALFGFSLSGRFWQLCLCAVPYGLGAGAVDAALNNYVALHYKSRHMNWLHCFWGVGAAVSPYIMGFCLTRNSGWHAGYRTVFIIQCAISALLFLSLPLWKKKKTLPRDGQDVIPAKKLSQIFRIKGVKFVLPAFFAYCALESTAGLWASSYLVATRALSVDAAARFASFFYLGITFGRFLCGFISNKIGNRKMIRIGTAVIFAGLTAVLLPVKTEIICLSGLIITGIGCAPVYPAIIHATPDNFGAENSQSVIGIQMASAYTGSTFMPPLFGLLAGLTSIKLYPVFLLIFAVLLIIMTEFLNAAVKPPAVKNAEDKS